MKHLAAIAAAVLLVACGGRDVADDQGLHNDIQQSSSGAEVTFDATVSTDPVQSGDHEVFDVKTTTGETLEIDEARPRAVDELQMRRTCRRVPV